MKLKPLHRTWLPSALSGALLLLTPFVVFVRYQGYPIMEPESIACFAILAAIGASLGLIMELAGQYSRVVIIAFLITLVVDIQVQEPERTKILVTAFAAGLIMSWLLRNHLARFGTFVLAVLFISSFILPSRRLASDDDGVTQLTPGKPGLPIVLHLILDEQIGVEGIPQEFDAEGRHAEALRDFYLDHGFQVFGRAYSRYYNTYNSIPNLLNFDAPEFRFRYSAGVSGDFYLKQNRYFELMRKRGYQIHVYQSDYLDVCHDELSEEIASCCTYELEALRSIADSPVSLTGKIRIVLGVYARLSQIMSIVHIPKIRVSSISSMNLLRNLQNDLVRAQPGMMFFVHLMLPHYPYCYRADCRTRDDPGKWLNAYDARCKPRNNDENSRAQRYPHYLEQLSCTNTKLSELFAALEDAGMFHNMLIIVHGDHGSRLDTGPPHIRRLEGPFSKSDFVDAFSTLFAVKWPGVRAAYDRRILPLERLFTSFIQQGRVPSGVEWAGTQHVYFSTGQSKMQRRDMPDFSRDLRAYEAGH